ncbi:MAG: flagellin lysine-N-methylase [Terracidiphilus sp.]
MRRFPSKEHLLPPASAIQGESPIRRAYADRFRCIGSACEDTCCQGWNVPIDEPAWEKYQSLPEGPLPDLIRASLIRKPEVAAEAGAAKPVFAIIRMNAANECPMLSADHLCRIQAELGESLLSHACATFPRYVHSLGGVEEKALTLSCPEAARLVLLTPDLLGESTQPQSPGESSSPANADGDHPLPADFWPIRAAVLKLVQNRQYPLWQRLFLTDVLCRRLDAIAQGELDLSVPVFLAGFESTIASGTLRPAMAALPIDSGAQLDVVLRLAGLMLHKSNVRPRFAECIKAFTAGIGNGPGATFESLTAQYTQAHDRCYQPFFDRHPHIMENFLVNTILRCQFPFGKDAMRNGTQPSMTREFALLAAQFALMRGLLIGVAGLHGKAFSADHVVHTMQAASRHFEHHTEFLNLAYALLVERNMDGARGLATLLRNVGPGAAAGGAMPASPGKSVPAPEGGRSVSASAAVPRPFQAKPDTAPPE